MPAVPSATKPSAHPQPSSLRRSTPTAPAQALAQPRARAESRIPGESQRRDPGLKGDGYQWRQDHEMPQEREEQEQKERDKARGTIWEPKK